jgi:hypothetical protein
MRGCDPCPQAPTCRFVHVLRGQRFACPTSACGGPADAHKIEEIRSGYAPPLWDPDPVDAII